MASVGTIEVALKATGSSQFLASLQMAVDKLNHVGAAADGAGSAAGRFKEKIQQSDGALGGFAKAAAAAATAAASLSAIKMGQSMAQGAYQANIAIDAFTALGGNMKEVRAAVGGMVDDAELAKKANLAQTMGISSESFKMLAQVATAAAAKTGQSMEYMFDSVIVGTSRESAMILDNLGIKVNAEKANAAYAKSHKLIASSLSDSQKKQAFMNAVAQAGTKMIDELKNAGISVINTFTQFSTTVKNLKKDVGDALIPIFKQLNEWLLPVLDKVRELTDAWKHLNPETKKVIVTIATGAIAMTAVASSVGAVAGAIGLLSGMFGGSVGTFVGLARGAFGLSTAFNGVALSVAKVLASGLMTIGKTAGLSALGTVTIGPIKTLGFLIQEAATNVARLGKSFASMGMAALRAIIPVLVPLLSTVAVVIGLISAVALLHAAWRTNWMGIRDKTKAAWEAISKVGGVALQYMVAGFLYLKDTLVVIWEQIKAAAVLALMFPVKVVAQVIDSMMSGFSGLLMGIAGMATTAGFDDLGKGILDAANQLEGATRGIGDAVADAENKLLVDAARNVQAPDFNRSLSEAPSMIADISAALTSAGAWAGGIAEGMGEGAKAAFDFVKNEWTMIARELGFFMVPDEEKTKQAGKEAGKAAAAELTDAVKKARAEFAKLMMDLRAKDVLGGMQTPFKEIRAASFEAAKELVNVAEKAKAAGLGMTEARMLIMRNAAREYAQAVNAQSSLEGFNQALSFAQEEIRKTARTPQEQSTMQAAFADKLRFDPKTLSDLLTQRVGGVFDLIAQQAGLSLSTFDRGQIVKSISDALEELIKNGNLDFTKIGEALGRLVAGADVGGMGKMLGGLFGMNVGGPAKNAFGGAQAPGGPPAPPAPPLGAAAGALAPAGAAAGGMGGVVGSLAGMAASVIIPLVLDMIRNVFDTIVNAFKQLPEVISGAIGAVADALPLGDVSDKIKGAFSPAVVAAGLLATALLTLGPPIGLAVGLILTGLSPGIITLTAEFLVMSAALVVIVPALTALAVVIALAVGAAAFYAANAAMLAVSVAVAAAIAVTGLYLFASGLGAAAIMLTSVFAPALMVAALGIGGALLAVVGAAAVLTSTFALISLFFKLIADTKSFERFKSAIENSVGRLTTALEPFMENMMAFAGLFDALVQVAIPLAAAFANNEIIMRALFVAAKMVAVGFGAFIIVIAVFISAIVSVGIVMAQFGVAVGELVTGMGGVVRTLGDLFKNQDVHNIGQGMEDAGRATSAGAQDISNALTSVSPDVDAMRQALKELMGLTYDEAKMRGMNLATEKDASEQLTNVPEGFKVVAARFRAISAEDMSTGVYGPDRNRGGGGSNFVIDQVVVVADNAGEFKDSMEREAERRTMQQAGTTGTSDVQNNGT